MVGAQGLAPLRQIWFKYVKIDVIDRAECKAHAPQSTQLCPSRLYAIAKLIRTYAPIIPPSSRVITTVAERGRPCGP